MSRRPPDDRPTQRAIPNPRSLPPGPSSEEKIFLDEESSTEPQGRTATCPKCHGTGTDAEETDGHSYKAILCDLCKGLTKVPRKVAEEFRIRNEPLGPKR